MAYWWDNHPWRLIQTNLREIDMLDIDAERYVADLQAFKATVALFNCAGIIASYPTDLPYHFQSPFLQGDDLERIIEACHSAGIRLLARTDFSKVRRPLYEAHPDWAYRTPAGDIVDYNGDVHVCPLGDYQQVYAPRIIEELITRFAVDGIFFNMGGFQTRDYSGVDHGICHCSACCRAFAQFCGLALPPRADMDDPVYRRYRVFTSRVIRDLNTQVRELIHRLRPDMAIDSDSTRRAGYIRQESNTAIDRSLPHWPYQASSNTKWAVGTYPEMISTSTSVDFIDFPYRHVSVSPEQQRLRLAQSLANGGQPDWYLIGRLDNKVDRTAFAPVRELFHYHAAHEDEYAHNRPVSDVLLLMEGRCSDPETRGWYRVLTEGHWLFDAPLLDTALETDWSGYRAIILPDVRPISDALAARIDGYVRSGGTLIAVHRAGLADEASEPREACAVSCLGLDGIEDLRRDTRGSYFRKRAEEEPHLPRLRDTGLVYLDGPYLYGRYSGDVRQWMQFIPPHPFGPPERCYYRVVVDRPCFTTRPYGDGKAIHVPWLPGSLFYRQGYVNTSWFMADLLEHIAAVPPLGGNLPEQVEVTRLRGRSGFDLVHLVNSSGHHGVSFFPPVVMTDLQLTIPCAREPQRLTSLVSGDRITGVHAAGELTMAIPRLGLMEAIRIEW